MTAAETKILQKVSERLAVLDERLGTHMESVDTALDENNKTHGELEGKIDDMMTLFVQLNGGWKALVAVFMFIGAVLAYVQDWFGITGRS